MRVSVHGLEAFHAVTPPALLVANHASHVDTPLILTSMPASWRDRTAVAAASDYFFTSRWLAVATAIAFGTFPVDRRGSHRSQGPADELLSERHNILVFPEGTRSPDGTLGPFRHGAARLSIEMEVPVVPIGIVGSHRAMPKGRSWPAPGRNAVEVRFGSPLWPAPDDIGRTLSLRIRDSIAGLIGAR